MRQYSYFFTLFFVSIVFLGCSSGGGSERNFSSADRPNVIIFYTDDLGYSDVSFADLMVTPTPWFSELASKGIYYDNFYSASSICSPARASLMTGKWPTRHGVVKAIMGNHKGGLPSSEVTLAEIFKKSKYDTAIYGKWHIGDADGQRPNDQGFDEFVGILHSHDLTRKLQRNRTVINPNASTSTILSQIRSSALSFIENKDGKRRSADQPFFMMYATPMPHVPLPAGMTYQQTLFQIDQDLGALIKALKDKGIYEDTMIVFASDNGPWVPKGSHHGESWPLRGTKGSLFEGGYKLPLVVSWPSKLPQGTKSSSMVAGTDFFATFVDLLGLPRSDYDLKDSESLHPAWFQAGSPHSRDRIFYHDRDEVEAARAGDWKYYFDENKLFHVATDPGEIHDLKLLHPTIVKLFKEKKYSTIASKRVRVMTHPRVKLRNSIIQNSEFPEDIHEREWNRNGRIPHRTVYYNLFGAHHWSIAEDLAYRGNMTQISKAINKGLDPNKVFRRFSTAGTSDVFKTNFYTLVALAGREDVIDYLRTRKRLVYNRRVRPLKHHALSKPLEILAEEISIWNEYVQKADSEHKSFFRNHRDKMRRIYGKLMRR